MKIKWNSKDRKSEVAPCLVAVLMCGGAILQTAQAGDIEQSSLTADFTERDAMPESLAPQSAWYSGRYGSWGPHAASYPAPAIPPQVDASEWRRARVTAVAKKYIGLPYQHHHIPAWSPTEGPGLDCSNFTAWVYNYGLGLKFTSNIHEQSDGADAPGRKLRQDEAFVAGDLLYITKKDHSEVSHCVIFIDNDKIIDSHSGSVQIRPFKGWYRECFSHARRIIGQ